MQVTIFGMTVSAVVMWIVIAVLLMIIEALTAGLTTIWFAFGAFFALVAALFSLSMPIQVAVFLVSSLCLLIFTRKIFVEKLKTGSQKTNVDALIGTKGLVVSKIVPFEIGQVKANGQVWSAVASDSEATIEEDAQVEVLAVEGVKLIVRQIEC